MGRVCFGVAVIFLLPSLMFANFFLALEASLNNSNALMSHYPMEDKSANTVSYSGGVQIGITEVAFPNLSCSTGFKLLSKGWHWEEPGGVDIELKYFEIPLRAKYSYHIGTDLFGSVSFGPYYARLLSEGFFADNYRKDDFGVHAEIGLDFAFPSHRYGLGIEGGYSLGLMSLIPEDDADIYNRNLFASLLIYFHNSD